jgi:hypothetical protein
VALPVQLATDESARERARRLAVELLEAQQRGDPAWIELAQRLAEAARVVAGETPTARNASTVARLATELAEQVLVLLETSALAREWQRCGRATRRVRSTDSRLARRRRPRALHAPDAEGWRTTFGTIRKNALAARLSSNYPGR